MTWSRRKTCWDKPDLLDHFDDFLASPLTFIIKILYSVFLTLRGNPLHVPNGERPIRVVCISDTHDGQLKHIPDGDLLIHAGDLTNSGSAKDLQKQIDWLAALPHKQKIVIGGNHDDYFDPRTRHQVDIDEHREVNLDGIDFLQHSSKRLRFGIGEHTRDIVIYGAPDTPDCENGSRGAWEYPRYNHPWETLLRRGNSPDILVTHTPPLGHLDLNLGCVGLMERLWAVKPKVHVFGHLHCGRGTRAAFWDAPQKIYEEVISRRRQGFIHDILPNSGWFDLLSMVSLGILQLFYQYFSDGGLVQGTLMVNAGCQDGNSGKLMREDPITFDM